jgi:hypothetical protein
MNIVGFEVVEAKYAGEEDKVFIEWSNGKFSEQNIYHMSDSGILCDDMETYIEFAEFEEVA